MIYACYRKQVLHADKHHAVVAIGHAVSQRSDTAYLSLTFQRDMVS